MTIAPDIKKETVLPRQKASPGAAVAVLRDVLLVTYAVPEKLVRPHIPPGLPLDRLPGENGDALAFVQTVCAYHDEARWSVLPSHMGQSYHQIAHRVLTRKNGKRGAFNFRTYLSTGEAHLAQRALSRDADFARFSVYISGNPARGPYQTYSLRAVGDLGQTNLEVRARPAEETTRTVPAPFASVSEMADFFVGRNETYFRASAPRATSVGVVPTETVVSETSGESGHGFQTGEIVSSRQTLWSELGIVSPDAQLRPFSVLLYGQWQVTTRPPRFAKFPAPEKELPAPDAAGATAAPR